MDFLKKSSPPHSHLKMWPVEDPGPFLDLHCFDVQIDNILSLKSIQATQDHGPGFGHCSALILKELFFYGKWNQVVVLPI